MKTKLRTCAAPGGGDSRCCQEGVGAGRGCGCRFYKLDFRVWALGLGLFLGQNPRNLAREESVIQQPEGLEGLGRFGCILDKHGLWLAVGIFLRIRGGVGRLRKKTKLIKCAAALGAGAGWCATGRHRALPLWPRPRAPGPARPPEDN